MKIRIFTAAILFLSLNLFSQDLKISGTVLDLKSGEPLVGATVRNLSTGIEVITDFDGNFTFSTESEGSNMLVVSYISYEEAKLNRVIVKEGQEALLTIKMKRVEQGRQNQSFMAAFPKSNPSS